MNVKSVTLQETLLVAPNPLNSGTIVDFSWDLDPLQDLHTAFQPGHMAAFWDPLAPPGKRTFRISHSRLSMNIEFKTTPFIY